MPSLTEKTKETSPLLHSQCAIQLLKVSILHGTDGKLSTPVSTLDFRYSMYFYKSLKHSTANKH